MRIRKKKNRDQRLAACADFLVTAPEKIKGSWQRFFQNEHPIHVEIGCGKGRFIRQLAERNPQINYIAIEKCTDVLVMAMEKVKDSGMQNIRFISGDAATLLEIFGPGECDRIYINFCDPWHKNRHAKRRLTHHNFLSIYRTILKPGGMVCFKTDNRNLFEFSLNEFADYGLRLQNISLDLHSSACEDNIMTEYEETFSQKGFPIYRCEVIFN